ncbi:hypothetical protein HispidOSU_002468 [Sigmodon hispidus]
MWVSEEDASPAAGTEVSKVGLGKASPQRPRCAQQRPPVQPCTAETCQHLRADRQSVLFFPLLKGSESQATCNSMPPQKHKGRLEARAECGAEFPGTAGHHTQQVAKGSFNPEGKNSAPNS